MERYEVVVSQQAQRQLVDCVLFIAKDDVEAAQRLRERLVSAIRSLEELPARYPFFNEPYVPANKYHKMFVENWYLILYQIRDDKVYVDFAVDCRRDYQWLVR